MRKNPFKTRAEIVAWVEENDIGTAHDVQTVISPTRISKRGDCRGNYSAQGHKYYVQRTAGGKLRICWRTKALEPRTRPTPKVATVGQTV